MSLAGDTSWLVRMAQFVPPPSAEALAAALPLFKKRRHSLSGTWLSSKTSATVTLSAASHCGHGPSIAVILQGHVHEEHLLSSVAFAWPRFCADSGNTCTPSRVIFASYKRNDTDEKRKFAMQFETILQAEWFFDTIKHMLDGQTKNLEISQSKNYELDFTAPEVCLPARKSTLDSDSTNLEASCDATRIGSLTQSRDVIQLSEISSNTGEPCELGYNSACHRKNSPLVLPPRFPPVDLQPHTVKTPTDGCHPKESNPAAYNWTLVNDSYLREQIQACFLDPEFQGFVERVEKICHSLENELANEISFLDS